MMVTMMVTMMVMMHVDVRLCFLWSIILTHSPVHSCSTPTTQQRDGRRWSSWYWDLCVA